MSLPNPLLRLQPIDQLLIPSPNASPDALVPLLTALLQEGVFLAEDAARWKIRGTKSYPASAAKVALSQRRLDLTGDTWICRRSVHDDAAEAGTASWEEFWETFKERHVESEVECMRGVVGGEVKGRWEGDGLQIAINSNHYTNFTLTHAHMHHNLPPPLADRLFPILQMTCSVLNQHDFLIVTLPIDTSLPATSMATGKPPVIAAYASVERIRKISDSGKIEWIMATTSDARGVLPMWIQTRAVPGQIAQDVPSFLGWIAKKRRKAGATSATAPGL